ncbi:MAG TPA: UDP-N-acetylmuramoyl-L-alanine--D-glutamate ligase [Candidatus Paceibacterota bacterium]|nr:UDP-N-acetylmuramoyl-L-alanine--D-glutamate ligase [Candidatus Paceibacterota bacterium]
MEPWKDYFKGKRITVMGLGLLGRGVGDAAFLAPLCAELMVTDLKSEAELADSLRQLKDFKNITFHLGGHQLIDFQNRDLILKAAGVPLDSLYIAEAKKNNTPVRMSADLFMELSGVTSVGITGTRGKSTVTHMLAHILKTAGKKVLLGGNVRGVSTLALLPEATPEAIAVLELDSWQCQGLADGKLSPHVAVFTTFLPDHMNYYKNDMRLYFADKANIFLYQKPTDMLVVGEQVAPLIKEYGYQDKVVAQTVTAGVKDIPAQWHLKVPGEHNRYDAGVAAAAARVLGINDNTIKEALESFEGVPGRLQFIREVRGIKIYNDTTATVPEATIAALEALDPNDKKNVVLIMGGADKGLDMSRLVATIPRHCKKVLLLAGTGSERIKSELPNSLIYQTTTDAVSAALAAATTGDIILLSPAFASFGMFKNEYDRGEQFNAIVAALA